PARCGNRSTTTRLRPRTWAEGTRHRWPRTRAPAATGVLREASFLRLGAGSANACLSNPAVPASVERVDNEAERQPCDETYPGIERQPEHEEQRRGGTGGGAHRK